MNFKNWKFVDVLKIEGTTTSMVLMIDGNAIDVDRAQVVEFYRHWERDLDLSGEFVVHISDDTLLDVIGERHLNEVASPIGAVSFSFQPSWNQFVDRIYFVRRQENKAENWAIIFSIRIWPEDWANPYTISEYEEALAQVLEETQEFETVDTWNIELRRRPDDFREERSGTSWTFAFLSRPLSGTNSIRDDIKFFSERFQSIESSAVRTILRNRKNALVTFFEFPPLLKTACEQYLVYFIQFLEDLGIRADSEIKQQAGSVMFSVTPKDEESALTRIKEALDIYLRLPLENNFDESANQFRDIAVTQLRANVFYFQSQLELARAVLQAKDATIEALDLVVFQQRQLLGAGLEGQSSTSGKQNVEPLLGNTVSITEYEGKGFRVNLPLIFRKLKRVLYDPDE